LEAGFAIVLFVIPLAMYIFPYVGTTAYIILASIPFLLGGFILAGIIQYHNLQTNIIYFADLIAAGTGAVGAIFLFHWFNPITTLYALSFILLLMFVLMSITDAQNTAKIVYGPALLAFFFTLIYSPFTEQTVHAFRTSPYNVLHNELEPELVFSNWDSFSKIDVVIGLTANSLYVLW
jgi:hypothetical protein